MEKLKTNLNPSKKEMKFIGEEIKDYIDNIVGVGDANHRPINIIQYNSNNEIIAGALGGIDWEWLYIEYLWVNEKYRKQNIGKNILQLAENEAIDKGATKAHLHTFNTLALKFYKKQGYEVLYEVKDLPKGFTKYNLFKDLIKK